MLCAAACFEELPIWTGLFPLGCSDSPMVAGWSEGFQHTEETGFLDRQTQTGKHFLAATQELDRS